MRPSLVIATSCAVLMTAAELVMLWFVPAAQRCRFANELSCFGLTRNAFHFASQITTYAHCFAMTSRVNDRL